MICGNQKLLSQYTEYWIIKHMNTVFLLMFLIKVTVQHFFYSKSELKVHYAVLGKEVWSEGKDLTFFILKQTK